MNDLWRALRYLWKYWGTTLGAFLSLLIVTATNLFSPQLLRLVIDQGISAQNLRVILLTSLGLLGVAIVRDSFTFTQSYWSERARSEEHTSELQSLAYLVCRLLL